MTSYFNAYAFNYNIYKIFNLFSSVWKFKDTRVFLQVVLWFSHIHEMYILLHTKNVKYRLQLVS